MTGREMDVLVAEKVMGWRVEHVPPIDKNDVWVTRLYRDGEEVTHLAGKRTTADLVFAVPHYSTNIADAWMVVEKIHAGITNVSGDGLRSDLNYLTLSVLSRYGATAASFDLEELPYDWFEDMTPYPFAARGDTPAHAICLAALKAVGALT